MIDTTSIISLRLLPCSRTLANGRPRWPCRARRIRIESLDSVIVVSLDTSEHKYKHKHTLSLDFFFF